MVVWSSSRLISPIFSTKKHSLPSIKRFMSGHGNSMNVEVSRWQWHKLKDLFHYYLMVGLIPATAVVFYANVFIGPSKLAEIPEGYTPKHWEYYSHPITRFISRYIQASYQQDYEKYMAFLYHEDEKAKMRLVTKTIKQKMAERSDYQAYYYRPITAKYFRDTASITEETKHVIGENV